MTKTLDISKRPYRRLAEPYMCSCGVTMIQRSGPHFRSAFHVEAQRVRALLEKDCIPISEIAARLGVTKQRLQQITDKLGIKGWVRRKTCTLRRRTEQGLDPRVEAALRKMRELGIEATLQATTPGPSAAFDVVANGKVCRVRAAFMPESRPGYVYLSATRPRKPYDFLLFWVQSANMWVVVPADRFTGRTMFKLEPTEQRRTGRSERHNWREYIEAWHLLKEPAHETSG